MKATPLSIPAWNISKMKCFNALIGRAEVFSFSYKDREYELDFVLPSKDLQLEGESKEVLEVRLNEENSLEICIADPVQYSFFDSSLDSLDQVGESDKSQWVGQLLCNQAALLSHFFSESGAQQAGVSVSSAPVAGAGEELKISSELKPIQVQAKVTDTSSGQQVFTAVVTGSAQSLLSWHDNFSSRQVFKDDGVTKPSSLEVLQSQVLLPGRSISSDQFESLAYGDVILASTDFQSPNNEVSCEWAVAGHRWLATCAQNKVTIHDLMSAPEYSNNPPENIDFPDPSLATNPSSPEQALNNEQGNAVQGGELNEGGDATDLAGETGQRAPQVPQAGAGSNIGVDLSKVQMPVTFRLGTKEVALTDLQSLKSGHVFVLDRPVEEAVEVMVNGLPYAEGRMVNIDGMIGVQLTEIKGKTGK